MANWQKIIQKHQSEVLEPGEELVATLFILPDGGVKAATISGTVGGMLPGSTGMGMRTGAARALHAQRNSQEGTTIAGTFPIGFLLITLTDRRLLVFERASMQSKRPERLVAEYPKSTLVGMTSKKAMLNRKLTFEFSDGSQLTFDGGIGQPYKTFTNAIGL